MKRIIDVCCGSKMFWFDKNNPDVEFCDNRELPLTEYYPGRYIEVNPDTVCDFTHLPFDDNSFYLAVFDPPHLQWAGDTSIMAMKYGKLKGDWKSMPINWVFGKLYDINTEFHRYINICGRSSDKNLKKLTTFIDYGIALSNAMEIIKNSKPIITKEEGKTNDNQN